MGYLGAGRLGVKGVGDGRIGQKKWEIGSKEISGSNKNGRNSKLRLGAGRSGEIKVGDWEIQTPPIEGLNTENHSSFYILVSFPVQFYLGHPV